MFIFRFPTKVQKRNPVPPNEVKAALERFLDEDNSGFVKFMVRYWKDQQTVLTYKEIREAILSNELPVEVFRDWKQDYSKLVTERLVPEWKKAMKRGASDQNKHKGLSSGFVFREDHFAVREWLDNHTAEMVTNSTEAQKEAIRALVDKGIQEHLSTTELAKLIRPCIGLTAPQTAANLKYYNHIKEKLKSEHPKMSAASIEKKANEAAIKYADKQMRSRALTIARTEKAKAYEYGRYQHTLMLIDEGIIPPQLRQWSSANIKESTCATCLKLEGKTVGMFESFKIPNGDTVFLPPLHPNCRCCIKYIDDKDAIDNNKQIPQELVIGDTKEYTEDEIIQMANEMSHVVKKHIDVKNEWSGVVCFNDGKNRYGMHWNGDIVTRKETAPFIMLHELLHGCSVIKYEESVYVKFYYMEEASVQFAAQEISIKESIPWIASAYDDMVGNLRKINELLSIYDTDYELAMNLLSVDIHDRFDWLYSKVYDKMVSIGDIDIFHKVNELIEVFYAEE